MQELVQFVGEVQIGGPFTAKRKEAYEALHPEARAGVAGGLARQNSSGQVGHCSFANDHSAKTGQANVRWSRQLFRRGTIGISGIWAEVSVRFQSP